VTKTLCKGYLLKCAATTLEDLSFRDVCLLAWFLALLYAVQNSHCARRIAPIIPVVKITKKRSNVNQPILAQDNSATSTALFDYCGCDSRIRCGIRLRRRRCLVNVSFEVFPRSIRPLDKKAFRFDWCGRTMATSFRTTQVRSKAPHLYWVVGWVS